MKKIAIILAALSLTAGACNLDNAAAAQIGFNDAHEPTYACELPPDTCDFEIKPISACEQKQNLLQDAWVINSLIAPSEWTDHQPYRIFEKDSNTGKFVFNKKLKKTGIFERGATYNVPDTNMRLEVLSIQSVETPYTFAPEGEQKAVFFKDKNPDNSDYYLAIKTSYGLTHKAFWSNIYAINQLKNMWWNSNLVKYELPDFVTIFSGDYFYTTQAQVAKAFYDYSRSLTTDFWTDLESGLHDILNDSSTDKKLIITGHSMSAAMAQIIAMDLKHFFDASNVKVTIEVLSSGAPRAGNFQFAKELTQTLEVAITRYTFVETAQTDYVLDVDPISCFPTYADGFRSPGELIIVEPENFSVPNNQNDSNYNHCNIPIKVSTPLYNMQTLYGYFNQHLPSAYSARYTKIEKQIAAECASQ